MRIGLYTTHAVHNVGAMLQAFALTAVLEKEGCEVEIINIYTDEQDRRNHHASKTSVLRTVLRTFFIIVHPGIRQMEKNFEEFHQRLPLTKRYYSHEEYMTIPNSYDLHLVGSDQVWNTQKGFQKAEFFFLNYLPEGTLKRSYGPSLGTTNDIKGHEKIRKALLSFDRISVREDKAVSFVEKLTGRQCTQVLDPTLLLNSREWDEYIDNKPILNEKYIFYYGVNDDQNTWNILSKAKELLGAKIVGYPGPLPPKYPFDKYIYNGGPLQFVNLIKHSELVVTSSFHGLAFAVNYHKKFMLVEYGTRMERMESLLRLLKATAFFAHTPEDVDNILKLTNSESFESIAANLEHERIISLDWIKDNVIMR